MNVRRVDVFFYGLFMDEALLRSKGVEPVEVRHAWVRGQTLQIGARAGLVRAAGKEVHGVLMKLTHAEIEKLYADPGVAAYRPEAVLAVVRHGSIIPALCYNLPESPDPAAHDAD